MTVGRQVVQPRSIAKALCQVSEEVVWEHISSWVGAKQPGLTFKTRVGTGKRTYCQFARREKIVTVVYGQKMIAEKQDYCTARRWLSFSEIAERNYFGRELTYLNVLAHTVCHEMAHVVQNVRGERYANSVHNSEFYRILDRMHKGGHADKVKAALADHFKALGIRDEFWGDQAEIPALTRSDIYRERVVGFDYQGTFVSANVLKVNTKTVTAIVKIAGRVRQLKVPISMCQKVPKADKE